MFSYIIYIVKNYKKTIFELQKRIKMLESDNYGLKDNIEVIKIRAAKGELIDIFGDDQYMDPYGRGKYLISINENMTNYSISITQYYS